MNTQQILTLAALHAHRWTPGTDWCELEHDVVDLFKTVREMAATMQVTPPTYSELKDILGCEEE